MPHAPGRIAEPVRNHVERTYAKVGASNRVGASLYALQHGLVAPVDPVEH